MLPDTLANEVLDTVKKSSPTFFENLVVDLLVAMGYAGSVEDAGRAVGKSGDGGIDGIIREDKLGLDFVYVQAKRWSSSVGRPSFRHSPEVLKASEQERAFSSRLRTSRRTRSTMCRGSRSVSFWSTGISWPN